MTDVPVLGANSEVGRLRAVVLHRPGDELKRLTPRNNDQLLFDGLPWVARAQEEHDAFAEVLRSRGVEVLLLSDLLREALASGAARVQGIAAAVNARRLGYALAQDLSAYLRSLDAADLAYVLMCGMTFDELPLGGGVAQPSLVRTMHHGSDFVIEPLPNLLFTRDSSFWIGRKFAITTLALPARVRETSLTDLIYAHHPRFLGSGVPTSRIRRRSKVAMCCCWGPVWSPSGWASAPLPRARKRWRAVCSMMVWRIPCSRCPSPRSERRCTWTPSARWWTPTRS
ncbi:amidinotransferase family protein [Mycobacteroides abscessus 1948]|uniref:Amidinotransferase family protein n=1 Tax=Mycobacteroides abscessus 1948 TaxID=1299323 RepID=A0A829QQX6_9MYCO|nr:amidinotransferase family protein [Mycobacteroides abscessus 1948]